MRLSPDLMKMFGMGGAGATAGAKGAGSIFGNKEMLNKVAGMDLSKTIDPLKNTKSLSKLFGGLDSWVNRSSTRGGLLGLLGSLGGIGGKESKFDADLGTGKNPFSDGKKPKWQNMGGEVMKIAHHTKLKPWQNRHLTNYDAMREGGMMGKKDYENALTRHKIDKEHWYR